MQYRGIVVATGGPIFYARNRKNRRPPGWSSFDQVDVYGIRQCRVARSARSPCANPGIVLAQYGDSLVCARYRYDAQHRKRFKTVELIVAQRDWNLPAKRLPDDAVVAVRVGFAEAELRRRVKEVGGKWNADRKAWELGYAHVAALKLEGRFLGGGRHLMLDAVAKAKGIYMEMRRRPSHIDAGIQCWMPASGIRCSGPPSNYSWADTGCRGMPQR